jgi:NTP pyrophosphatase (non-canonical NTP hydrolase)
MTPHRYHHLAARTRMAHTTRADALSYAGLKLAGEAGEVLETALSDVPASRADKIHELGDLCWYVALIADTAGIDSRALWIDYEPIAAFTWYNAAIRLSVAASATSEAIGKALWHGRPESAIYAPLSRTVAAIHACAEVLGVTVEEVWAANVAKLKARHPEGWSADYRSDL